MNNLVEELAGVKFGKTARGDVDSIHEDVQKLLQGKAKSSSLDVAGEDEEEFIPARGTS